MGFLDFISDAFTLRVADAEAQPTAEQSGGAAVGGGASAKGTPASGTDEESPEEAEVNKEDQSSGGSEDAGHKPSAAASGDDDEAEEPAEEEEEEEEEPEDIKPKLEEECGKSAECGPYKHHYDECVERVTSQMEEGDGKAKENCVEEFFHLAHCATNCAAPKLFKTLK